MTAHTQHPQVIWDVTYACPFRCEHCYTEAGRRSSMRLPDEKLFALADVIARHAPVPDVLFAGGEPLLVKALPELAGRLRDAGSSTHLYTSGWRLDPRLAERTVEAFSGISVSLDGADAALNDHLRGRDGAFDTAMAALTRWDDIIGARARDNRSGPVLGIECTVMRSNIDELERFCTEIAPMFPNLGFLAFGPFVPSGLASRASFCEQERFTAEQRERMPEQFERLQRLAPDGVAVRARSLASTLRLGRMEVPNPFITIQANGDARAHPFYEATVGNLLDESLASLWQKSKAWATDPFVAKQLSSIRSQSDWGSVTRTLDQRFAPETARERVARRGLSVRA